MVVYTEKVFYDAQRQPFTMFRAGTPGKNVWHEQASGATVLAQLAGCLSSGIISRTSWLIAREGLKLAKFWNWNPVTNCNYVWIMSLALRNLCP